MSCKHDKVYNTKMILTTSPPMQAWICRKCGATGIDRIYDKQADEYDDLFNKFHGYKEDQLTMTASESTTASCIRQSEDNE